MCLHPFSVICKDSLNSPFCDAILVVGTNSTEFDVLEALVNLIKKSTSGKDTLVRLLCLNGFPLIKHVFFIVMLCKNCSSCCKIDKVLNINTDSCMINKDTTARKHLVIMGFTHGRIKVAHCGHFKVIHRNMLARKKLILFEGICVGRIRTLVFCFSCTSLGLAIFT